MDKPRPLANHPNLIRLDASRGISHGFVAGDADLPAMGSITRRSESLTSASLVPTTPPPQSDTPIRQLHLASPSPQSNVGSAHRPVIKVDDVRRQKHKQQNQRHHDVVVQASPFVRPPDVSRGLCARRNSSAARERKGLW